MTRILSVTLVIAAFVSLPSITCAGYFLIAGTGTVDENSGYILEAWQDMGHLDQVFFVFPDAGRLRIYAERDGDEVSWHVVPDDMFLVPTASIGVTDSWPYFHDRDAGTNTAEVVGVHGVQTPYGVFTQAYRIEVRRDADDELIEVLYVVDGIGVVAIGGAADQSGLSSLQLNGGDGMWPLAVGNRWDFSGETTSRTRASWSRIKETFRQ